MIAIDRVLTMRRVFVAATIFAAMLIALLPAPASAQGHPGAGGAGPGTGPPGVRTDAQKKKDAEIDQAYKDALKRNSAAPTAKSDPWQTIRPANDDTAKQR